jgi:hypothetical protein
MMSLSLEDLSFVFLVQFGFGLYWLFTGLNGFFNWIKIPEASPQFSAFVGAFYATGFFMPTIKSLEIFIGILLIVNIWTGFALVVAGGLIFVIVPTQLLLNWPKGLSPSLVLTLPYIVLIFFKWELFQSLF